MDIEKSNIFFMEIVVNILVMEGFICKFHEKSNGWKGF